MKLHTSLPSWLRVRVRTVTMPACGRLADSRFSRTIDSLYSVSPAKTGWVMRISSQPRLAKAFWVMSVTLCPTAMATVRVETTSGLPNSDFAAYSLLKCIWFVFIVSSVNQVLSASVTVRPSGCR